MSELTGQQLAGLGIEAGVAYLLLSEVPLRALTPGDIVLKTDPSTTPVSLEIRLAYVELIPVIAQAGPSVGIPLAADANKSATPEAVWIEGEIIGASAGLADNPKTLLPFVPFVGLVDFRHPRDKANLSLGVWLKLMHDESSPGSTVQIGTATELLNVLTGP